MLWHHYRCFQLGGSTNGRVKVIDLKPQQDPVPYGLSSRLPIGP
jgi:hypothetical protein